MPKTNLRKTISQAILNRAITLTVSPARAKIEAKAYFLGAELALKHVGDTEGADICREAYSVIVEGGLKTVLKWAEMESPFNTPDEDREAA